MSYQLKVIQDSPIGFWPLDESSGTTAADISGCGNNGTYVGGLTSNILPLVTGGVSGSNITNTQYINYSLTKDYYGTTSLGGLANKYTSDNDFSLEIWVYPKIVTNNFTPIFADLTDGIGIFWDNGNIVFKVQDERLDYTVPFIKKAHHVVAQYSGDTIYLYVDGVLKEYKSLSNFKFTNTALNLSSGPTLNASDSFTIDAPAVYRYTLNQNQILNHYNLASHVRPIQVVYPDEGYLISTSEYNQDYVFSYSYPANRPWKYFNDENLYINEFENYASLYKTATAGSQSVVLEDAILVPSSLDINASRIEWSGTNGVSVEVSNDGITYQSCTSGSAIPMYILGNGLFTSERTLYIRITISSTDTSKYVPRLDSFNIKFFKNKRLYSQNSGIYLTSKQPAGLTNNNNWDLDIATKPHSILSRHYDNGVRPQFAGFYVNSIEKIKNIEFFLTPASISAGHILYASTDSGAAFFAWNGSGVISKSKISAIYVNGIDRSSATNISSFILANEPHHIFIVLSDFASGDIWFNVKVDGATWYDPQVRNLYQNIGLYNKDFTVNEITEHYALYTGAPSSIADDSSVTVTELEHFTYDADWVAIKGR